MYGTLFLLHLPEEKRFNLGFKMTKRKVYIVGAGIGGLAAGALLSKQGYQVELFEREHSIGGRAQSIIGSALTEKNYRQLLQRRHMQIMFSEPTLEMFFSEKLFHGYQFDLGFHAIGGGAVSNINNVLKQLNSHVDMLESHVGFIHEEGFRFPFLSRKDKLRMLPNIFRLLVSNEKTMKQLDAVSMSATINRYGRGVMKLVLEVFSRAITTVNDLSVISTGEMFRSQKNLLRGSKPVGYPVQGLQNIYSKLANAITQNNGNIYLDTPITEIKIKEGKVTGVSTKDDVYSTNIAVSNVLVQDLFQLCDEKHFSQKYVHNIKSLNGTGSLCAYYALENVDPSLLGKAFLFIERNCGVVGGDAVGMIDFFFSALPTSGLAPKDKSLIQAYVICTPEEARSKPILEKLKKAMDNSMERLIPGFQKQLLWAVYPAIWHLDGVAKTIDNVKPQIKTPIEGLYLVGDCVKAPGIGINCAINSANMLQQSFSDESYFT